MSVFASSNFGLDYAELTKMSVFPGVRRNCLKMRPSVNFSQEFGETVAGSRSPWAIQSFLKKIRSKKGWEGFIVAPIFLFGFRDDASSRYASPALTDEMPQINYTALRSLTSADRTNVVDEVVHLSLDLGFEDPDFQFRILMSLCCDSGACVRNGTGRKSPDPTNLRIEPSLRH